MARAGRKDRGLLAKKDSTGKTVWYVRLYHEGKERRFGSFSTKTAARDFYEKAKQEQGTGGSFLSDISRVAMRSSKRCWTGTLRRSQDAQSVTRNGLRRSGRRSFQAARLNALTPTASRDRSGSAR